MISEDSLYVAIKRALRSEHGAIATGDCKADKFLAAMLVIVRSDSGFAAMVRCSASFRRYVAELCLDKLVSWLQEQDQIAMIQKVLVEVKETEAIMEDQAMSGKAAVCCVCLDNMFPSAGACPPVKKTSCNHLFHADCILDWLLVSDQFGGGGYCPICRFQILSPVSASSF